MAFPARLVIARDASARPMSNPAPQRNRSHAIDPLTARSAAARAAIGPRPMVRATAGIQASQVRPTLIVVPRRRRAARLLAVMCAVIVLAMLGAAAFQTLLAQRQLELDRLDTDIAAAREHYEVLRQERAELRSPQRLAGIASAAGMGPARQSTFVQLPPELIATVQESVGTLASSGAVHDPDRLDQFRLVKSMTRTVAP